MFSGILRKISKKINLRLSAIFSLILIISSLFLFGITYTLLASFLLREDAQILRLKILEFWAHYQSGGVSRVMREVNENRSFIVRVADGWNNTLYLWLPAHLQRLNVERLKLSETKKYGRLVRLTMDGSKYTMEIASIKLSDGNILQIGMDITARDRILRRVRVTFVFALLPLVVLSFLIGSYLSARSLKPISNLSSTVKSVIDTGKINTRISPSITKNELGDLVVLFNRMLEKIELLVEGMRRALDSVAHDLRTPMTRLRGTAEMALKGPPNARTYSEALADCMEESEHIITMLNTIMDIAEAETGTMKLDRAEVKISTLIEECAELYSYVAEEKDISIHTSFQVDISVFADKGRIRRAILNLLDNAVKYTSRGGRVDIGASARDNTAVISVKDNGVGIEKDELPNIWERLYRGKEHRSTSGLGLGLSFVKAIVLAHGGEVEVTSKPCEGSKFTIVLPLYREV